MVYIYLPATYCHLNLDVTKANLLAAGFSAVPAVFLVLAYGVQSLVSIGRQERQRWLIMATT